MAVHYRGPCQTCHVTGVLIEFGELKLCSGCLQKHAPAPSVNPRARPLGQADGVRRFFTYEHLPEDLQAVSKPFYDMMLRIDESIPYDPEREEGLRHLLLAKDCIVRAFHITRG